jgi:hypothetical protein
MCLSIVPLFHTQTERHKGSQSQEGAGIKDKEKRKFTISLKPRKIPSTLPKLKVAYVLSP